MTLQDEGRNEGRKAPRWGAELREDGSADFALWAPGLEHLSLRIEGQDHEMSPAPEGWFTATVPGLRAGLAYSFVLPGGDTVPDPAARRQIDDVNGPSRLTAPHRAKLGTWTGRPWEETVLYELHVGTFTPQGTFTAAAGKLEELAATGITAIELLPLAQFGGDRGWGYDGVLLYAPHPSYGTPDELRALIRRAHDLNMSVLLDVVYNHFGPEGNHLGRYAPDFFDPARQTPWGAGIDYTRQPVRRFFIDNARYWIDTFGFDGLRFDAIDQIKDPSDPELLIEMAQELRAHANRPIHLTTEDNRNVTFLHERGPDGAVPLHSAEWNDDMHNAAHVIATGETEGYYGSFAKDPLALFARALAQGYAFQGEVDQGETGPGRGAPSGHLPPDAFIDFLQNHDQTGNRACGDRLTTLADARMLDALQAILLLSPHIPMLFMGEEYGETAPFLFFAGFEGDLAEAVTKGRRAEFSSFAGFGDHGARPVPDPIARSTFEASKLDWDRAQTEAGRQTRSRIAHLLTLRAEHVVPLIKQAGQGAAFRGEVLAASKGCLAVDWHFAGAVLSLRANLGEDAVSLPGADGQTILGSADRPGAPFGVFYTLNMNGASS
ncbi:malto-oligosyltrehalose trehalohydrolase [Profundibacterium mesophilum]|uniref:Malto-oligosyltrehalose trehalohydrolase n=1 Tax=Profundibacterium mesophilum KAUST100406-0324 TaxID=1037889 RepID=A0A921NR43_9RHOB|nr:malto-oligosyltrehalose trehalohydrolase [Profundibacterium mesophilum]KAF0676040.1 14-alpha-glucan branching enzyme [Profundibacterium mesophilum KAUST100406-0324]